MVTSFISGIFGQEVQPTSVKKPDCKIETKKLDEISKKHLDELKHKMNYRKNIP
jgi:hypothetical protein